MVVFEATITFLFSLKRAFQKKFKLLLLDKNSIHKNFKLTFKNKNYNVIYKNSEELVTRLKNFYQAF